MTEIDQRSALSGLTERARTVLRPPMTPSKLRTIILGAAALISLLGTIYWMAIASDRYVSEAHVLVQRTDSQGFSPMGLGSLLSGITEGGSLPDQKLLRDHLLSVDMIIKLDKALNLRKHFSDWHRDPLSRLWDQNVPIEKLHAYFLDRTSVEFDDHDGVLVINSQAFDPKIAQAIVKFMLDEGEAFMNRNDHRLARAQVNFLDEEVERMRERNLKAQQAVLDFQNSRGFVSTVSTVESIAAIVSELEARRAVLQTQKRALESYLVPGHPNLVTIEQELEAIESQISDERSKIASQRGRPLNQTAAEFERLKIEAEFSQQLYQTTLAALEKGRIDAMRTVKKLSIVQSPTLPEASTVPRRAYNSIIVTLIAFVLAGVCLLFVAIIRDHLD